jgi:hypothetical protein
VIKEGQSVIQWNDRHVLRATGGAHLGDLSDNQVRWINAGRTAVGWAALWEDYKTLGDRYEAARRGGLIAKSATIAEFVNRATSVLTESANAALAFFKWKTEVYQAAMSAARTAGSASGGIAEEASAELRRMRWQNRADALGAMRYAVGIAGAVQIVSSTLNLIRAIENDDVRAGVGAGHGIIQGGITLGGAVLKASTGASTMVSGSVAVVWITIEALFDIAELSAWGRRQAAIAEIARPLEGAASLIPWGKRMAGVADALTENDSDDDEHRAALEAQLVAQGTEPFNTVLRGMLGVQAFIRRKPDLGDVMGAEAQSALRQLQFLEFRGTSEPVSPWDIQMLSEICAPIFAGLQRVGLWAIATYGEERASKPARERLKALQSGEPVPAH